jgi:hypothetical protein
MKHKKLSIPSRWGIKFNPAYGIDWKHDDEGTGTYTRTFGNLWELGEWLRDRYGATFSEKVKKLPLSNEWQGKTLK